MSDSTLIKKPLSLCSSFYLTQEESLKNFNYISCSIKLWIKETLAVDRPQTVNCGPDLNIDSKSEILFLFLVNGTQVL